MGRKVPKDEAARIYSDRVGRFIHTMYELFRKNMEREGPPRPYPFDNHRRGYVQENRGEVSVQEMLAPRRRDGEDAEAKAEDPGVG